MHCMCMWWWYVWYWPSRKVNQEDRNLFTHCDDHVGVGLREKHVVVEVAAAAGCFGSFHNCLTPPTHIYNMQRSTLSWLALRHIGFFFVQLGWPNNDTWQKIEIWLIGEDVPPNRIPRNRWSIQAKKTVAVFEKTDERVTQFCFVCWHFRLLPWFRIEFQLRAQRILRELTDFTGLFGGDQSVSTQWITVSSCY